MALIDYSLFKNAKHPPCSRIKLFLRDVGKEKCLTYEEYLDLPWAVLSDVGYFYRYSPEVIPNIPLLESNFRAIGFLVIKKMFSLFPHPVMDEFSLQYGEAGKIDYVLEQKLIAIQKMFSSNIQIHSLFSCVFSLITPEYDISYLDNIVITCSKYLGEDSLLLQDNLEIKKLLT